MNFTEMIRNTHRPSGRPGWYSLKAEAAGGERRAELHIYDVIAWYGVDAQSLVKQLAGAGDLDVIDVFINSPGGSAFDGMAIYNALRRNKARVNVVIDGLAASAASLIAMAGDTLTMMRGSEMMIHDAWGYAEGNAATMIEAANALDKLSCSYADCYAARAGGDASAWREVMRAETWFSAAEAVEAGLADSVDDEQDATDAKARFDLSVFAYAGRDHAPAPTLPTVAAHDSPAHTEPGIPTGKEVDMSDTLMAGLRERLGMADADASEETILAALDEALAEQATHTDEQANTLPDGIVPIEADVLDAMRAELAAKTAELDEMHATAAAERRDGIVAKAIEEGRIAPARREHWLAQLNADEEGAVQLLATLAPGTIPLDEIGHSNELEADADGDLYAKWTKEN